MATDICRSRVDRRSIEVSIASIDRHSMAGVISTHDPELWRHDWSSQLYTQLKQLWKLRPFLPEFSSSFNFTTAQVMCIGAMINYVFISFSTDQIYDLLYIRLQRPVLPHFAQSRTSFHRLTLHLAWAGTKVFLSKYLKKTLIGWQADTFKSMSYVIYEI